MMMSTGRGRTWGWGYQPYLMVKLKWSCTCRLQECYWQALLLLLCLQRVHHASIQDLLVVYLVISLCHHLEMLTSQKGHRHRPHPIMWLQAKINGHLCMQINVPLPPNIVLLCMPVTALGSTQLFNVQDKMGKPGISRNNEMWVVKTYTSRKETMATLDKALLCAVSLVITLLKLLSTE